MSTPIRRIRSRCCATANGAIATAPPARAMKSRRLKIAPTLDKVSYRSLARWIRARCGSLGGKAHVRGGSKTVLTAPKPTSDIPPTADILVKAATSEKCQQRKWPLHSITSSARSRNDSGIARPMAFAVLRLTISSYLVGCSTGSSLGRAPLRILSASAAVR